MPNYTILLIDYDPRSVELLRVPLVRAGFRVEVAPDGIAGIKRFHQLHPDLTLIEAMIPKKHGFEVCQELKTTPHGKNSPVFIVTSVYKGRRYRYQAQDQHGCDEFLEKPISDQDLMEAVARHIDLPPASSVKIVEPDEQPASLDQVLSVEAVNDDAPATEFEGAEAEDAPDTTDPTVASTPTPAPHTPITEIIEDEISDFSVVKFARSPRPAGSPPGESSAPRHAAPPSGGAAPAVAPARPARPQRVRRPRPVPDPQPTRSISHDRMMLWLAVALLSLLGVMLSYIVLG